ncbi:Acylphosphatase [Myriangium duriaei CBS 260.36]|uniref:Acylphosphatase n=1 Tax=Myriangium duriaei CBS 260.36 TaxID=1168546 RepID=A0A9P4MK13_9PEZI|nr:Acylphosphatase [Myriangium duriaei CBS 260.36]
MPKRISYTVEGVVQGVNFRSYTVKQASQIGLTGFVKNDSGGTVSGEAQGDDSAIKQFVQSLNKGPSAADVAKVDHKDIPTKDGESGFDQA